MGQVVDNVQAELADLHKKLALAVKMAQSVAVGNVMKVGSMSTFYNEHVQEKLSVSERRALRIKGNGETDLEKKKRTQNFLHLLNKNNNNSIYNKNKNRKNKHRNRTFIHRNY